MRSRKTALTTAMFLIVTSGGAAPPSPRAEIPAETAVLAAASAAAAHLPRYVIRPGDTLTGIAQRHCGRVIDWTGLYHANQAVIGPDPNRIYPGRVIVLACYDPPVTAAPVTYTTRGDRDRDGDEHAAPAAPPAARYQATAAAGTYQGSSAMQRCIIARESGGNSQVMNSTSHYGLYQFAYATWVANGGNPADFGHASVAEQNRVFWNTVARSGYSAWTPYDGCLWNRQSPSALYW